jgi:hypothetical protein
MGIGLCYGIDSHNSAKDNIISFVKCNAQPVRKSNKCPLKFIALYSLCSAWQRIFNFISLYCVKHGKGLNTFQVILHIYA